RSKRDWSSDVCSSDLDPCVRPEADETLDALSKVVDGLCSPMARNTLQTHNHRNHERFDRPAAAVLTRDAPQHQDAATECGAQAEIGRASCRERGDDGG